MSFIQRTMVQFPGQTWQVTTIYNSRSKDFEVYITRLWSLQAPDIHVVDIHTVGKTLKRIKINQYVNNEN